MAALSPSAVPDRAALRAFAIATARRADAISDRSGVNAQRFGREGGNGGGVVHVNSYVRIVDGKSVQVSAHTRADPPGGNSGASDVTAVVGRPQNSEVPRPELVARRDACEVQRLRDDMICRSPLVAPTAKRSCWASVSERYAQCLRGGYIPPLWTGR